MKAKHTPGPWQLAEKYNCCDVRAVDGPYVASSNASAAIRWDVKEANARLIAAAPELLEALNALLDADLYADGEGVCFIKHADTDSGERAVKMARAAIAKAEGA